MNKKRRLKKKPLIVLICMFLLCFIIIFLSFVPGYNIKNKLSLLGYNQKEIKSILNKVPKSGYNYFLKKYNKSIVDLITAKNYKDFNFKKYIIYYEKNPSADINDIISIINSGYDLMNYPASPLLANLVKEKYYINKNVARYLDYGNEHDLKAKMVISIVNSKADYDYYTHVKTTDIHNDNLILVNKFYHLPNGYKPADLVTLTGNYNQGPNNKMRKEAAEAFMKMVDGAMLDNIILKNSSAYRSYDYQVSLYEKYVDKDGAEEADIYSARPGYSEHQTGLCVDINTIDSSFADTKEAKWLADNAYKYGFILRFPKGKEKITGYKYEPWHYRYVGKKVAKLIYNEDLTFEEYYAFYIEK